MGQSVMAIHDISGQWNRLHLAKWWRFFVLVIALSVLPLPLSAQEVDIVEQTAQKVYEQYAHALIRGQFDRARTLSTGEAYALVDKKQRLVEKGEDTISNVVEAQLLVNGAKVSKSQTRVAFRALFIVDTKSPVGDDYIAPDLHRQSAIVALDKSDWKVIKFEDSLEKCCL
ncbi:MAG: hypothetical protein HQL54_04880 [Magnetococcales bacterium]|nr:hypothetical protein [Magnetococcales bacterium]